MSLIRSDDTDALVTRADAHFSALRFGEAMNGYRNVLAVRPRDAHALHRMGLASVHLDQIDQARGYLEQAVQAAPDQAELREHAGLLAALKHDDAAAEAHYRRAIALAGNTASLHRNLADCLRRSGRLREAMAHYKQSVEIDPALHHAVRAMARISTQLGAIDDAADYWLRAWALDPADLQDGLDLIAALAKTARANQLEKAITQIRTRFAGDAAALKSLSFVLNANDRFNEALSVARQGLAIDPHYPLLHHNAARALSIGGRTAESRPHSMEAARLLPDNSYMQFHLAGVQLALGEFEAGWKQYRWFYELPDKRKELVYPSFPEWKGEPVAGRQFLLVGEQGRGDEIQFIRFAEWLHRQGATVDVLVSAPIAELATSMTSVRTVLTTVPSGPYDYWSYMLRMPEYMKLDLPTLPIAMPYLTARPEKIQYWEAYIDAMSPRGGSTKPRRVGVVWAGSPYHALDRYRSVRLEALKPLLALQGVTWYSVQKGDREHESEGLANEFDVHTLGPAIKDFTDTLAILHAFDLLITVDTSVAHLAGAAGLPVWVLVPAYSEWRWLTNRTDSPWYPSMRLFRQQELGEWDEVIEAVRGELSKWCDV
ncbi:tetratricopeptide repeat protein [Paraburkholderia sp. SIMBA_030]|uniref:tetratricopeptide repeat protein n=1 Tax=Paraburkholderia sp. SIMBA_030 TaxID=3085773 RepID=UPI00397D562D